jgi:CzcA family heavy metal efflux pump
MFAYLIRQSLTHRIFVLAVALILVIVGAVQMRQVPVDILPEIDRSIVSILTEAGGLSAEEVERRVSFPIETAMTGLKGVERVRSRSSPSLSIVSVSFALGTDIYRNRQLVAERLTGVQGQLPGNLTPELAPMSSAVGQILRIAMTSDTGDMMALRDIADWVVRPRILGIPGVAQVVTAGGEVRQLRITPDPRLLDFFGIPIGQLEQAFAGFNSNTGGDAIDQSGRRSVIVNLGRAPNIEALLESARDLVVGNTQGRPILLRQVASVSFAPRAKVGDAGFMGKRAVVLFVMRQPGVNALDLTRIVKQTVVELQPFLPPGMHSDILLEQAKYVERSIANLTEVVIEAIAIVAILLFAFLLNFRTTAISLAAIPVSLLITMLVFWLMGMTINTMTLGGLAIAVGELVDDAVVGVENTYRRLRQNREKEQPLPALRVIADATVEVRSGIFYATVIMLSVFFPLFFLPGVEGLMFQPLAVAYVTSIFASLVTSVTLTPVLAYYLLPQSKRMDRGDGGLVRFLKRQNERLLLWAFDHWRSVATVAVVAVTVAALDVAYLPRAYLPPLIEGTYQVELLFKPGFSLPRSMEMATLAERLLLQIPEVTTVGHRTGRAERDLDADPVNVNDVVVGVRPSGRSEAEVLQDIRKQVGLLPGTFFVTAPIADRINSVSTGINAPLAVKVFGQDLDTMMKLADELRGRLTRVPGLTDVKLETQARVPAVRVRINPKAVQRYGATSSDLTRALETLVAGRVVAEIIEETRRYDVLVRLDDADRTSTGLRNLLIDTPLGRVPLHEVTEIADSDSPDEIIRDNGHRRIAILINTNGSDMTAITRHVEAQIAQLKVPAGYYLSIEGNYKEQQAAMTRIGILSLVSIVLVFAILYSRYNSTVLSLIILANVPLALVGSVFALRLTGGSLSLATAIGFITLAGISTRNGILKISHYINLVLHEGESFGTKMIVRGSLERMTPVLMTALSAGLALVPIMVNGAGAGTEILAPVAVVIFGGLISATLLDAVLTPVLFLRFGAKPLSRLHGQWASGQTSEAY